MWSSALFFASCCLAYIEQQPLLAATYDPLNEKFGEYVKEVLDHFHVPSISIAVIRNGTVYSAGYGNAILPDTAATPETLYYVGSTTKSFVAAAVTVLMDDARNTSNAFDWKTPVVNFIRDDFVLQDEYITTHVTLEDLASHRTGMPRHDLSYGSEGYMTVKDTIRSFRYLPLTAGLRETFQYCNLMWATLGHIAEVVSSKSLGQVLRERIWKPLGMNSTFFFLEDAQTAVKEDGKELARGYTWDKVTQKYYEDPYLDIGPVAGAGSMISTVLDYAKYLRMMLQRAGPVSEEGHTQLRRARSMEVVDVNRPGSSITAYTLGWDIVPYRGINIRGHNGGLFGFGALMFYVPELDFGIAMLANTAGTSNYAETVISRRLLDDILGTPENERFDWKKHFDDVLSEAAETLANTRQSAFPGGIPSPPKPATLPLEAYEGTYWSDGYRGITFNISTPSSSIPGLKNTKTKQILRAEWNRTWPGHWELEHISGDFFIAWFAATKGVPGKDELTTIREGFAAEFRIGADGKVGEIGIALEESMEGKKIWFKKNLRLDV